MRILATSVVLSLALTACKTTGVDNAENAAQTMRDMMTALEAAPTKIDSVASSLQELAKEGGDMKAEFAAFSGHVDSLISHRDQIRNLKTQVESSRATFVNAWEEKLKTMPDEELRERAQGRRDAVIAEFAKVKEVSDSGKAEFEPWMKNVESVRTYIEHDLNPSGVASVKDRVEQISKGAVSVNKKITTVVSELERIGKAISAAKPPADEKK